MIGKALEGPLHWRQYLCGAPGPPPPLKELAKCAQLRSLWPAADQIGCWQQNIIHSLSPPRSRWSMSIKYWRHVISGHQGNVKITQRMEKGRVVRDKLGCERFTLQKQCCYSFEWWSEELAIPRTMASGSICQSSDLPYCTVVINFFQGTFWKPCVNLRRVLWVV